MSHTSSLVSDTGSISSTEISAVPSKTTSLRHSVREFLRQYMIQLDNMMPNNVYEAILTEAETPLLEIVLQYAGQNQSKAAKLLNMSRGTLRKKMKQCGLLPARSGKITTSKSNLMEAAQ